MKINLQYFAEEVNEDAEVETKKEDATKEVTETSQKTIPYERFKQVNDDLRTFKETFESLGIDGIDGLSSLVEEYKTTQEAIEEKKREEMTEIERLKADLEAKEEAEKKLAAELENIREQSKKDKIANAFIQEATKNNVEYIEDAFRLADLSSVEVSEDGSVVGIDEVVKGLIDSRPFLVKRKAEPIGEPSNGGKTGGGDKAADQLLSEAKEKAIKTGRAEDRAAYAQLKRELQ